MEAITLDEAIEKLEALAVEHYEKGGTYNRKYAAVTAQLAAWLADYRVLRRGNVSASEKSLQSDRAGVPETD